MLQSGCWGVKLRDPARIPRIITLISDIWLRYPDLRLTQLIGNLFDPDDLYYKEDDDLEKRLMEYPFYKR